MRLIMTILLLTAALSLGARAEPGPQIAGFSLDQIEERLRATPALGIGEKLDLKARYEGLMETARAYHHGRQPLSRLATEFNAVMDWLQPRLEQGDPSLNDTLQASRGTLWELLVGAADVFFRQPPKSSFDQMGPAS